MRALLGVVALLCLLGSAASFSVEISDCASGNNKIPAALEAYEYGSSQMCNPRGESGRMWVCSSNRLDLRLNARANLTQTVFGGKSILNGVESGDGVCVEEASAVVDGVEFTLPYLTTIAGAVCWEDPTTNGQKKIENNGPCGFHAQDSSGGLRSSSNLNGLRTSFRVQFEDVDRNVIFCADTKIN